MFILSEPWTAGSQTAAGIELPNPVNPPAVSPSEGWKRRHISTRREEDKISQSGTKGREYRDYFESNTFPHPDPDHVDLHSHQQRVQNH